MTNDYSACRSIRPISKRQMPQPTKHFGLPTNKWLCYICFSQSKWR